MDKKDKKTGLFILTGLMILTLVIYSGSMNNGFMWGWDDGEYLEDKHIANLGFENTANYFSHYYLGMYQPLSVLSIALNISISGTDPAPYHATNVLLHLVNVALVFLIFRRLLFNQYIAALAALIFAIHPMNVEAVAWIAARSTTLFTAFFLGSILTYLRYQDSRSHKHYLLALLFFVLSLFSKSMAISLPIVFLILDYLKEGKVERRAWIEKIPFLFLSVIFGIVTIDAASSFGHLEGMEYSFAWINRPFLLSYAVSLYLFKFLLPIRLSVIYGFPEESGGTLPVLYYLSMILIILLAVGLWRLKNYRKELRAGMFFFLLTIAPVLPIFWSRMFLAGERYVYLPYIGLLFMLGTGIRFLYESRGQRLAGYKTGLTVVLVVFLFFLGISTFQRTKVWAHPESLLSAVINQDPSKNTLAAAYFFRGNIRDRYQDYPGALRDFNESLLRNPENVLALNNRGIVRGIMKDFEGAVMDFTKAMELNPEYVDAYYNRGIAFFQLKEYEMACLDWEKASSMGSTMARTALQKYCRSNQRK